MHEPSHATEPGEEGAPGTAGQPRGRLILWAVVLAIVAFGTRWALRTTYILEIDPLQAILGVAHYDVALHMPHPPGMPVYMALLRAVDALVGSPDTAVLLLSSVADAVAAVLVFGVATAAVSARVGVVASLVYVASPLAWHSATLGRTFGVDACLSAGIGLAAVMLFRRPGGGKAVVLGALLALLLGVRNNVNLASLVPVPLALAALWRVRLRGKLLTAAAFGAVVAAWAVPLLLMGASSPGYVQATYSHWYGVSLYPSPLANALYRLGVPTILRSTQRVLGTLGGEVWAALGAGGLFLPFLVIPVGKRTRSSVERTPWGLLLLWTAPALLLPLASIYHPDEYVAVAMPPLAMAVALGLLRLAALMRAAVRRVFPPPAKENGRVGTTLAATHVLALAALNGLLLQGRLWSDWNQSRTILGREHVSMTAKAGYKIVGQGWVGPRLDRVNRVAYLRTVTEYAENRQAVVLATRRDFMAFSLYLPQQPCLSATVREDGATVLLARNGTVTVHRLADGESVPLPEGVTSLFAADALGGRKITLPEGAEKVELSYREKGTLWGGVQPYTLNPARRLALRYQDDAFRLEAGPESRAAEAPSGEEVTARTEGEVSP